MKYIVEKDGESKFKVFETKDEAISYCYKMGLGVAMNIYEAKEIEKWRAYPTLREYIEKHSHGAYDIFIFYIDDKEFNCKDIEDFEEFYNKDLLDEYCVVVDSKEGREITTHHLELEEIEEEE